MPSDGMSNSERFYMSLCAKELAQKRAKETTMTTNDDAPRDAVAEARALLAYPDSLEWNWIPRRAQITALLRALADECDALRGRVAALEAANDRLVNERLEVAMENYGSGFQDALNSAGIDEDDWDDESDDDIADGGAWGGDPDAYLTDAPKPTPRDYLTNLVRSFYNNSEANATVDFHVNRLLKTFALPMRSDQILHVLAIALDLYIFIQYLEIHAHRDDPSFDVNAVPHTPVLEALEEYGATLFFYLTVAYRTEGVPALAIQTLATPAYVSQWAHRHLGLTLPNFWPQGFMQSEGDPDER